MLNVVFNGGTYHVMHLFVPELSLHMFILIIYTLPSLLFSMVLVLSCLVYGREKCWLSSETKIRQEVCVKLNRVNIVGIVVDFHLLCSDKLILLRKVC